MSVFPSDLTKKVAGALQPIGLLKEINYKTETIQQAEGKIKCFCPIHKEPIFRTLTIDTVTRTYVCSNKGCEGHAGGDLIDLYARCKGLGYDEALMELAGKVGVEIDPKLLDTYLGDALEIAHNFREMGVTAEAEEQYEKVLRLRPESLPALDGLKQIYQAGGKAAKLTEIMVRLARVYVTQNRHEEAAGMLRDYVKYNPEDDDTRNLYIQCLKALGRADEVAQEYIDMAQSRLAEGKPEDAVALYRQVEAMNIPTIDVSQHLIQLLLTAGKQADAIEEMIRRANRLQTRGDSRGSLASLQMALEVDPKREDIRTRITDFIAHEKLGGEPLSKLCRQLDDMIRNQAHAAASRSLDKLIEAFPRHSQVLELKGDLEAARGHHEAALEFRMRSIDLYESKRELDHALIVVDKALAGRPGETKLLSRRAEILRKLGREREAADSYVRIIEAFEAAGDFENAAAAFEAVIELQPDNIEHRKAQFELCMKTSNRDLIVAKCVDLARAYRAGKKRDKALAVVERAQAAAGDSADLLAMHAEMLEDAGRKFEAAEQFLSAAKLNVQRGELEESLQRLESSLRCMPEHMESRELRADVLMRREMFPEAIREYNNLSQFYLRASEAENAIRLAEKILEIEPENPETLQVLAASYGQRGDVEEQRSVQMRLVGIYRRQKSYTPATEICEAILDEDEDYGPALQQLVAISESTSQSRSAVEYLWKLAQSQMRGGLLEEERRTLRQILEKDPRHESACRRYLELMSQWGSPGELADAVTTAVGHFHSHGQTDQIIRILDELRLSPTPKPEVLAGLVRARTLIEDMDGVKDALRIQAQLLSRSLRDREAVDALGELARLLPEDLSVRKQRIELMIRSDRKDEAAAEYMLLAKNYQKHQQLEAAAEHYREAVKLRPNLTDAHEQLISIYIKLKNETEAVRSIEALVDDHMRNDRFDEAIRLYERFFEFQPESEDLLRKIIMVKKRAGDNPGTLEYYKRLLSLLLRENRAGAYEQVVQEALALDAGNIELRRELAEHFLKAGRNSEGEHMLREIARLQLKDGDHAAANETTRRILELNEDSVQGRTLRAEILALQGDKDQALKAFMELSSALAEQKVATENATPFALGNYEGPTRIKDYAFDNFIVGSRNNFAHATALAVSRSPGRNYNPFFLYSDVGMGKTHLCHAVANYILDNHPSLKVFYTMTEDFIEGLIDSIQNNTVSNFRNRHRLTDVLIIDDIQFLSGKERAQEEFFHIFNALFQANKQIIITSDRPPKSISHLEKRLRSRFGSGIIVDIQPPDIETRIAIIRQQLSAKNLLEVATDDAVLRLAESINTNIRDLKGALTQVVARHEIANAPITPALVEEVVERFMDRSAREPEEEGRVAG